MSNKIYYWSLFRESEIYSDILDRWEKILSEKSNNELVYQSFLQNYPGIFFTAIESYLVVSKLKLGSDYETDFVVVNEGYSSGTEYEVIEIESPHTKLFDKKGNPTSKFNSALQQIRDWKRWLIDNKNQFRKIFPTQNTKIVRGDSKLSFTIIIGRRDNTKLDLEKRKQIELENNIKIMSFDRLTDFAKHRKLFFDECAIYSAQMNYDITNHEKNELANPFYTCIKDSEWRKLCYNGHSHIYSSLIKEILQIRRYNSDFEKFKIFHDK